MDTIVNMCCNSGILVDFRPLEGTVGAISFKLRVEDGFVGNQDVQFL
jgi:hypothetical protein